MGHFFTVLKSLIDKHRLTGDRIYNVDETGVTSVQKPGTIIAKKGEKQVGKIVSAEKGRTVTAVCAVNAEGTYIPPALIFPRKRMQETLMNGSLPGAVGYATKSGWMDQETLLKWLDHFYKYVKASGEKKVLLILDNHSCQRSMDAIVFARENHIGMLSLPPHTSHRSPDWPLAKAESPVSLPYKTSRVSHNHYTILRTQISV